MNTEAGKKGRQWQILLDKLSLKLDEVKSALTAIYVREKDLSEKENQILELKKHYSENLHRLEQSEHALDEAMRLRNFMIHLDKTLSAIHIELKMNLQQKALVKEEFTSLEQERLKFETLKTRAGQETKRLEDHKEMLERDLSNSLRHSKSRR